MVCHLRGNLDPCVDPLGFPLEVRHDKRTVPSTREGIMKARLAVHLLVNSATGSLLE
jgi:hypothetical protein